MRRSVSARLVSLVLDRRGIRASYWRMGQTKTKMREEYPPQANTKPVFRGLVPGRSRLLAVFEERGDVPRKFLARMQDKAEDWRSLWNVTDLERPVRKENNVRNTRGLATRSE